MPDKEANEQNAFIHFMQESEVLRFGSFITKSGRETPYFINAGQFNTGSCLERLGEFYARLIHRTVGDKVDNLYGPAYKGIPLATTTAAALWRLYRQDVSVTYNRKEAKDHGEGGELVGHRYSDGERVVIVEDVITAGTSIYESIPKLKAAAAVEVQAVVIAVDRQERTADGVSAIREIRERFGIPVFSIVSLDAIINHLRDSTSKGPVLDDKQLAAIIRYRQTYGV